MELNNTEGMDTLQREVYHQLQKIQDDSSRWNQSDAPGNRFRYTAYAGPVRLIVEVLLTVGTCRWMVDVWRHNNPYPLSEWRYAKNGFGTHQDGKREAVEFALTQVAIGCDLSGRPAYLPLPS